MTRVTEETRRLTQDEPPSLLGLDYIEFYVGNAHQAAHYYCTAFGFTLIARAGLETGVRHQVSLLVEQHDVRLLLTSPLSAEGPVAEHVRLHGDGVKDIAFRVDDAARAFEAAVGRGAEPVMEPTPVADQDGQLIKATIAAYGDTVHSFIQRENYGGRFAPGFEAVRGRLPGRGVGLTAVDHLAISVEPGTLGRWVDYYERVFGFRQSHQEDVWTEYSAMNSKVVEDDRGLIKFPIVEPCPGKRKSQVEEYLNYYRGPGVQHLALSSNDIVGTVSALRANGNEFLSAPSAYYEMLEDRVGEIGEDVAILRELGILVDRDAWGHLFQIFTRPLQSRPTVFFEIIQRRCARGFGSGNIKALFEAIEREQALRGNL